MLVCVSKVHVGLYVNTQKSVFPWIYKHLCLKTMAFENQHQGFPSENFHKLFQNIKSENSPNFFYIPSNIIQWVRMYLIFVSCLKIYGPKLLCILQGHLDIVKLIIKFKVWFASVMLIFN